MLKITEYIIDFIGMMSTPDGISLMECAMRAGTKEVIMH